MQELRIIAGEPPGNVQAHASEAGPAEREAVRLEVCVVEELIGREPRHGYCRERVDQPRKQQRRQKP